MTKMVWAVKTSPFMNESPNSVKAFAFLFCLSVSKAAGLDSKNSLTISDLWRVGWLVILSKNLWKAACLFSMKMAEKRSM